MKKNICLSCGHEAVILEPAFSVFQRITSDAKIFCNGGVIGVCLNCSLVQKICDEKWLSEINNIYDNYETFSLDGIRDQSVFDDSNNSMRPRCDVVLDNLQKELDLSQIKNWLDFGCGRGAMLAAISSHSFDKYGYDLDRSHFDYLKAIPGFKRLFSERDTLPDNHFDVVSMIHSIEHFTDPVAELSLAFELIKPDGHLFIQVNDTRKNPFEILVADHLTHFEPATLVDLVAKIGFEIVFAHNSFVGKEISLLAKKTRDFPNNVIPQVTHGVNGVKRQLDWLNQLSSLAKRLSHSEKFGLFGSSIAATWLFGEVDGDISYFVDEDLQRSGSRHLGKIIKAPQDLSSSDTTLIGLIPNVASGIFERLKNKDTVFILPPEFNDE